MHSQYSSFCPGKKHVLEKEWLDTLPQLLSSGQMWLWKAFSVSGAFSVQLGPDFMHICGSSEQPGAYPLAEYTRLFCHPDDGEKINAYLQALLAQPQTVLSTEHRIRRPQSGQWLPVRIRGALDAEGTVVHGLGQVMAQPDGDSGSLACEHYKTILDNVPFPLSVTDMEHRRLYLNKAGRDFSGVTDDAEMLGKTSALWASTCGDNECRIYYCEEEQKKFTLYDARRQRYLQGQSTHMYNTAGTPIGHIEAMMDMTEIHNADERALVMFDATPLCCNFWDRNYNNIDCNQEAVNLFELKDKKEYLDKFFQLSPEIQPDGRLSSESAMEKITVAFETGYNRFEWMHQKLDATPMPSEITLVRVKWRDDYIVAGYTRDLRELKATQAKLDEERVLLKQVLDNSPICLLILIDGVIRYMTPFTSHFLGAAEGQHISTFSATQQDHQRLREELQRTGLLSWRPVTMRTTSGELKDMLATVFFAEYYGEHCTMAWLVDVTEMRKQEHELRLARDAAEESTRAKSEFLANMSHEIRTPMNAILGMTHLALRTVLPPKQRDYMEKVEQSAKALLRIINDILDFSKIEAGKLEMEIVDFSLKAVVQGISDVVAAKIAEKHLNFSTSIDPALPDIIKGDPLRLHQVLLNLVGNAIKFTERGSIAVSVSVLSQADSIVELLFTVSDTGIGMKKDVSGRLFSPFTQADSSTTRKYGGTGLGLAICKRLVEMMYGKIWCESVEGQGSTFSFTASFSTMKQKEKPPILHAQGDAGDTPVRQCEEPSDTGLAGARILLVEDNEINQLVAQELLEIAGSIVTIANNGLEALEALKTGSFDIILMDIQMPEMDGLTAAQEIRKNPQFASLPIIAMTAHAMAGDKEKSLKVGMNAHVTKPIDATELYTTLSQWLTGTAAKPC